MSVINHPVVGRVEYSVDSGRVLLGNWDDRNIITVHIPQLKGIPTYGAAFSGNVQFYKHAAPQLKAAFAEVEKAGLLKRVIFWDGSFVPRTKRGSKSSPSNHAFGTAFDINAAWNPFRRPYADKGEKGSVVELVPIFERFGFRWGGNWDGPCDGMHFEVRRLLASVGVSAAPAVAAPKPVARRAARLVVTRKLANGQMVQSLIKSSALEGGRFECEARELVQALGVKVLAEHNRLSHKTEPTFEIVV